MQADVFTLFPQWFEWFRTQRHVENALALGHTVDAGAIVTAVVTLGHAMGLQVTAEGVETADQEVFLRTAGCNVLQGFLF